MLLLLGSGNLLAHGAELVAILALHLAKDVEDDGVIAVHGDGEVVGHLAIEAAHLATTCRCHILHAAHKLVLRDDNGGCILRHSLERYMVVYLGIGRHLALEHGAHDLLLL